MKLQLEVTGTDGTRRIVRTERDDAQGRRIIDKVAFGILLSGQTASVRVYRRERVAQAGGSVR